MMVNAAHARRLADTVGDPDAVLKALADPHRRQILHLVRDEELAAGQIGQYFDMTQQAVSQHLQVLKTTGLINERREGTKRLYLLRPEAMEPLRKLLAELWPDALVRLKQVVEHDVARAREGA